MWVLRTAMYGPRPTGQISQTMSPRLDERFANLVGTCLPCLFSAILQGLRLTISNLQQLFGGRQVS